MVRVLEFEEGGGSGLASLFLDGLDLFFPHYFCTAVDGAVILVLESLQFEEGALVDFAPDGYFCFSSHDGALPAFVRQFLYQVIPFLCVVTLATQELRIRVSRDHLWW